MNSRNAFLFLIILLVAVFAWLNIGAIMQPTDVNLGVTTINAPLGMILLAVIGTLAILFLVYMSAMQGRMFMESRNLHKELEAQRKVADQAEASRLAELKQAVLDEFATVQKRDDDDEFQLMGRVDRLEDGLRETFDGSDTQSLREFLADEIAKIEKRDSDDKFQLMSRIDRLEEALHLAVKNSTARGAKAADTASSGLIADEPDTPPAA